MVCYEASADFGSSLQAGKLRHQGSHLCPRLPSQQIARLRFELTDAAAHVQYCITMGCYISDDAPFFKDKDALWKCFLLSQGGLDALLISVPG